MGGWVRAGTSCGPRCWGWYPRSSAGGREGLTTPLHPPGQGEDADILAAGRKERPQSHLSPAAVAEHPAPMGPPCFPAPGPPGCSGSPPSPQAPPPAPQPPCFIRAWAQGASGHSTACPLPSAPAKPTSPCSLCWRGGGTGPNPAGGATPYPPTLWGPAAPALFPAAQLALSCSRGLAAPQGTLPSLFST